MDSRPCVAIAFDMADVEVGSVVLVDVVGISIDSIVVVHLDQTLAALICTRATHALIRHFFINVRLLVCSPFDINTYLNRDLGILAQAYHKARQW